MNDWRPVGIVHGEFPSLTPDVIMESGTGVVLTLNELLARYNALVERSISETVETQLGDGEFSEAQG